MGIGAINSSSIGTTQSSTVTNGQQSEPGFKSLFGALLTSDLNAKQPTGLSSGSVTGSANAPSQDSPDEQVRLQRRSLVQNGIRSNISDLKAVMDFMTKNRISVAEAANACEYPSFLPSGGINITNYLRQAGAPDGFQGLKVWTPDEISSFQAYAVADSALNNWFGSPGTVNLNSVQAQEVMDREARRHSVNPNYVPAYQQDWQTQIGVQIAARTVQKAQQLADPMGSGIARYTGPTTTVGGGLPNTSTTSRIIADATANGSSTVSVLNFQAPTRQSADNSISAVVARAIRSDNFY